MNWETDPQPGQVLYRVAAVDEDDGSRSIGIARAWFVERRPSGWIRLRNIFHGLDVPVSGRSLNDKFEWNERGLDDWCPDPDGALAQFVFETVAYAAQAAAELIAIRAQPPEKQDANALAQVIEALEPRSHARAAKEVLDAFYAVCDYKASRPRDFPTGPVQTEGDSGVEEG